MKLFGQRLSTDDRLLTADEAGNLAALCRGQALAHDLAPGGNSTRAAAWYELADKLQRIAREAAL